MTRAPGAAPSGAVLPGDEQFTPLNARQREVYRNSLARFESYLRTEGKDPQKSIGYAERSIGPRVSRFHRLMKWIWTTQGPTTEFTTDHADQVINALRTDRLRTSDGDRFSEGSKRNFVDVLRNWFAFRGTEWEPAVSFSDEPATANADPFTKHELQVLWQTALEYKTIPTYNNLSPEERDRWKSYIAQEIGKPKSEVTPADWDAINNDWKIPSLIRTTREAGWRPAMVQRLGVSWYDPDEAIIAIPAGQAVKNDIAWEQALSDEAAFALDQWLDQRANMELYDSRSEIWLNREGNPYGSGSLNRLLRNLMSEAGISERNRNLVWYSFRHSIGTYVFADYKSLKPVAETLRQKSTAAAARYVHATPELKREIANLM